MSEPGEDLEDLEDDTQALMGLPMSAQPRLRPRLRSRPSPVTVPELPSTMGGSGSKFKKKTGNVALEIAAKIITPETYRHARGIR